MAEPSAGPRPFWSGTVTFGLVSIPVELFSATRSSRASLRMLGPDGVPLRRRYVSSGSSRPLDRDETVRGVEVEPGRFVTVTDEELEQLEPARTREIDLRRFVDRAEIDPIFCDRPYFLLPQGEITKPYRLLARTMEETGRAGIASVVMRGREHLIAIFAERGILRAETLRRPDEVRTPEQIGLPDPVDAPDPLVDEMRSAIEAASAEVLDPAELTDTESQALRELAQRKSPEERVEVPEMEPEDDADVVDIMAVLRERLGLQPQDAAGPQGDQQRPAAPPAAPQGPQREAGDRPQGPQSSAELEGLTKAELYRRAQERDIPGRSKMSREELIAALS